MLSTTRFQTNAVIEMKDFSTHIVSAVKDSMWTGYAADCVIKTNYKTFPCHRIVLSMSSSFLSKLLESTPSGRTPEIVIPDVNPDLIQSVISLIYTGEACIAEDLRYEFFSLCHLLELQGIETFHENATCDDQDFLAVANTFVNEPVIDEPSSSFTSQIDNSQDYADLETDPMEGIHFESSVIESKKFSIAPVSLVGKIIQDRSIGILASKRKFANIKDKDMLAVIHDRLEQVYRRAYCNHVENLKIPDDQFKGTLVMNGSKLLKGQVKCVFCVKNINVYYVVNNHNNFRQWACRTFLKHLMESHPKMVKPK